MSLSINLATRGRPELLLWTIEKTLPNIVRDDTTLMISIDKDDPDTLRALQDAYSGNRNDRKYQKDRSFGFGPHLGSHGIVINWLDREDSLGAKFNRVCKYAPADVYLTMVDYAPHVTPGFDQKILDAAALFADGIGVVYNQMANQSFPEINAVTEGLVEKMGYIYPPYFPFWWIDHWLDDIARMIGRIACADVEIDVSRRPGTQGRRDVAFWAGWYNKTDWMREGLATSIIGGSDFRIPEWYKQVLLSAFPLVRGRSESINRSLIAMNPSHHVPDDPHYQRLRVAAEAILTTRP